MEYKPNNPIYHYNRGFAYSRCGKTDEAQVDFRRVIELDPNCKLARDKLTELEKVICLF